MIEVYEFLADQIKINSKNTVNGYEKKKLLKAERSRRAKYENHAFRLFYVILAILLGLLLGGVSFQVFVRIFATWNAIFGQHLGFCTPLIVLGLVTHGIADLGNRSGRLLFFTVTIAYLSTVRDSFPIFPVRRFFLLS